ncbi:spore photoproduct lyase [Thermovenabulum sp.]|uniref:spore photoproduct lyase n=1 Tax=Thermovenabulum sp. TaxID=3100335 RepID=UPI003C7CF689
MYEFIPKRAFFEKDALEYPMGKNIYLKLQELGVDTQIIGTHNRVTGIPGKTAQEAYLEAKRTLVVGVRRTLDFETCKPSAHYQLPLVTSCPGECEYCYLNTTLGKKPYIRVYVNIDEILKRAKDYMEKRAPEITLFEGSATSDPLPVEIYTGSLRKTIEFFGNQEKGLFRFVTKFVNVDPLLEAKHNKRTTVRFSINSGTIIKQFEHKTPSLEDRIGAALKLAKKDYKIGFMIGPIIYYPAWEYEYDKMLSKLAESLKGYKDTLEFELITHRFTVKAKKNILQVFPKTKLPLEEKERVFKFGQFGYGKYLYPAEKMQELKSFFEEKIREYFPAYNILYFV